MCAVVLWLFTLVCYLLLAGGVSLWAVSPRVVFPPAVFGGCPPPVLLSRVVATFLCDVCCLLWRPGAWRTSWPTTPTESGERSPRRFGLERARSSE